MSVSLLKDRNPHGWQSPPSNFGVEQSLLGAILINNDAYYRVSAFLEASHFFEDLHQRIYEVATDLIKAGKVADPITMRSFLGDQASDGVTVSQYLAHLAAEATTVINAKDYGDAIRDLALRRELISITEHVRKTAYDAPVDAPASEQIYAAQAQLARLSDSVSARDRRPKPVDLWGKLNPPELPRSLLPAVIEDFARARGEMMGADPSGLAVSALAVCAAAIQDRIKLQVRRYDEGWRESARLWVALGRVIA